MRDYGQLTTGDGVEKSFTGEFVHQYLQIGDGVSAPEIRGLNITVGGDNSQRIDLPNTNVLNAIAQIVAREAGGSNPSDSNAMYLLPVADGFIPNQSLELTIRNGAAATPDVKGFSVNKGSALVRSGMKTIQASDSKLYNAFDYLVFEDDNFDYADIVFADGHSESNMDESTLLALLGTKGLLFNEVADGDVIAIDNTDNSIAAMTIYSTSGGTMTITNIVAA